MVTNNYNVTNCIVYFYYMYNYINLNYYNCRHIFVRGWKNTFNICGK